jgi:Endoglucanase
MRGINLAGAEFGSTFPGVYNTDYTYPGVAQLNYYKARGIELIRLPFKWERIQHTLNGPLDTAELARLDTFLNLAEARGMRVILDMHNYGRYRISGTNHIIGTAQVPRSAFQDVWERIAAHVKDRDCIWAYGIMNEPHDMGVHTWKDSAQVAVDGIRLHDTRHAILLPGDGYSGAHRWLTHGADLLDVVDPADNVIFEAHQYFDNQSSGLYDSTYDGEGAYPNIGVDRLTNFVNWCNTNGVRGFLGEYGVPDNDPRWLTVLQNTMTYMAANNISGTYWAGGPWWGDYTLSTEPRRSHDEAPQMGVLIPHGSGVGTRFWPAYTWYRDAVNSGAQGSYNYNYKSTTASLAVDFADPASATGSYSGAKSIHLAYTVPSGGWAGAGMNINGGAALAPNFDRGHVLTFYVKGSAGSSVRVFFQAVGGTLSAKVNTASYVTTSGAWQKVSIPLSAFVTGSFTGATRVDRIAFEGLPADNTARVMQLDQFVIERPDTAAPTANLAVSATTVPLNTAFTATATASDAGGAIDFVEFLVNGQRVAIDDTAPYAASISLATAGAHRITAIAYDMHGNPARTTPIVVTAQGVTRQLTAHDTGSSQSFSSGLHWDNSLAPQAGAAYVVDGYDLRTSGVTTNIAFAGDSLTLKNGGRLLLRTEAPSVVTVGDLHADGGEIALARATDFVLAGEITLHAGGLALTTGSTTRTLTISAEIKGSGGLTHSMAASATNVTLTHANNTYGGGTVVAAGLLRAHADRALGIGDVTVANGATLRLASGSTHDYIANNADVIVGSSGSLQLAFTGTDTIGALSLDGGATNVAIGVWGAPGSGAANTSSRITGSGWLNVTAN